MRWLPFLLVLLLCAALLGCQVEVYRGLTEAQVNTMLSTLLKRGIRAEKTAAGKAGFTLSVDEDQLVQSLEILKENNLPRADYENLGKVFFRAGDDFVRLGGTGLAWPTPSRRSCPTPFPVSTAC